MKEPAEGGGAEFNFRVKSHVEIEVEVGTSIGWGGEWTVNVVDNTVGIGCK